MAFHFQTFKTRALTAIVFTAVMLAGLLTNQWTFLLLFSVIHFGCWVEYQRLVGLIDPDYQSISRLHKHSAMQLGWGFMLWNTGPGFHIGSVNVDDIGLSIMLISLIGFIAAVAFQEKPFNSRRLSRSVFGLLYISLSWGLLINLRSQGMTGLFSDLSFIYPMILIISIWVNDTMAYIVGSFIGKTPFSSISPKKTWEGTIGGALLAIVTVSLTAHLAFGAALLPVVIISAIAAVFGTLGDLLESKLKRMAGVKDSGQIMPGHGGFLDRFDSLLFATPFVWLYVKFLM